MEHVQPGMTCLDIGAAEGYFTLLMAKLAGPAGIVYAFEPGPDVPQIQRNLDLNPTVPLAPVKIFDRFVGNQSGDRKIAIDDLVRDQSIANVNIVKVDVDGGEVDVLHGMSQTLRRFRPAIFIEVHSRSLMDEVEKIMTSFDYSMKSEAPAKHEVRPIDFNMFYYSK